MLETRDFGPGDILLPSLRGHSQTASYWFVAKVGHESGFKPAGLTMFNRRSVINYKFHRILGILLNQPIDGIFV